jgi:hypothetical protein
MLNQQRLLRRDGDVAPVVFAMADYVPKGPPSDYEPSLLFAIANPSVATKEQQRANAIQWAAMGFALGHSDEEDSQRSEEDSDMRDLKDHAHNVVRMLHRSEAAGDRERETYPFTAFDYAINAHVHEHGHITHRQLFLLKKRFDVDGNLIVVADGDLTGDVNKEDANEE